MLRRSFLNYSVAAAGLAIAHISRPQEEDVGARKEISFDLRNYLDASGNIQSEAHNSAGLDALFLDISRVRGPVAITGRGGEVYRLGGSSNWIFPKQTRLQLDGAEFHLAGFPDAAGEARLRFSEGCTVEGMALLVSHESFRKRLVDFDGSNAIRDCHISCLDQAANEGGLLDYAVRIKNGDNVIDGLKVENFDKALIAFGANGNGRPGRGNRFRDITVINYVTGFELRNLADCHNEGFRCSGRAPNAQRNPGQNGLLHSGVADYTLRDFEIDDAGEHGCRFGGTRYDEQESTGIRVSRGRISRSAQTGLKFYSGKVGQRFRDVTVENVDVIDCQYVADQRKTPGFNDEGFLLQQIEGGRFTGITVTKTHRKSGFSADCGIFITGASNLSLNGISVSDTLRDFIRISQWDDGVGKAPVEVLPSYGVSISNAVGRNIGGSGFFLDFPSSHITHTTVQLKTTVPGDFQGHVVDGNLGTVSDQEVSVRYSTGEFGTPETWALPDQQASQIKPGWAGH